MRTLLAIVVGSFALLAGCSTPAHTSTAPVATPIEPLAPFAPLIGGTWSADFNADVHDEQQYEWVYGGKFLRNRHWVKTKDGKVVYEGETIYAWDERESKLVAWYWNATGGFVEGTVEWDRTKMIFEGENHAGAKQTERVRSSAEIRPDEWIATGYFWKDGAWVPQGTRTYRRTE
jgi:hypothetical protein